jgi:hypothetical protein
VLERGGRIEWLRVARRELEAHRTRQGAPVARDRDDRSGATQGLLLPLSTRPFVSRAV